MNVISAALYRARSIFQRRRNSCDSSADYIEPPAMATMEITLEQWTEWWKCTDETKSNERLGLAVQRAESELERYFGLSVLKYVKSSTAKSGPGREIFAADRLFEAFLGKRAAIAMTRKLFSNPR